MRGRTAIEAIARPAIAPTETRIHFMGAPKWPPNLPTLGGAPARPGRPSRPRQPSRGLDGGELPAVRSHRARERPVLVDFRGGGARAVDHVAGGVVDGVVEHRARQMHGDEVLTAFLPRLGHVGIPELDLL